MRSTIGPTLRTFRLGPIRWGFYPDQVRKTNGRRGLRSIRSLRGLPSNSISSAGATPVRVERTPLSTTFCDTAGTGFSEIVQCRRVGRKSLRLLGEFGLLQELANCGSYRPMPVSVLGQNGHPTIQSVEFGFFTLATSSCTLGVLAYR